MGQFKEIILRIYLNIYVLVAGMKKSYLTTIAGSICIIAGCVVGLRGDWINASIALTAGTGLLFAKDV
jgi:hypothetical protein